MIKGKRSRGAYITEFAVVCVIGIPLILTFLYGAWELCQYFTIKAAMDQAALTASRNLVMKYNNTAVKGTSLDCLGGINNNGFVRSQNQFAVTWDAAGTPTFVQVVCSYPVGASQYGLNPFPNPDIFHIIDIFPSFTNIYGQYTMPVQ